MGKKKNPVGKRGSVKFELPPDDIVRAVETWPCVPGTTFEDAYRAAYAKAQETGKRHAVLRTLFGHYMFTDTWGEFDPVDCVIGGKSADDH